MVIEQTLAIIKPDAMRNSGTYQAIMDRIFEEGFTIRAIKKVHLRFEEAARFYREHLGKPFHGDLANFMSSKPVQVMILEAPDAISLWRQVIGATDSANAKPGTIRWAGGSRKVMMENCVHGSDSIQASEREIFFFFPDVK